MKPSLLLMVLLMSLAVSSSSLADGPLVFITSFAAGDAGAVHVFRMDSESGALTEIHTATEPENPFFLALHPAGTHLYATRAKVFSGKEDEAVEAYAIDRETGSLTRLNQQSSRGRASCYIAVDATGRTMLVANYTTGDVTSLPVAADGTLGESVSYFKYEGVGADPKLQAGPRAHSFITSPDNRFAFAADLGLDKIVVYKLDAARAILTPHDPPFAKTAPVAGPRHLTFNPSGRSLYAINEMGNTISVFGYDAETGVLTPKQDIATVPADFDGKSFTADVKITPDGRYLYGTNRGHDSIASYSIAEDGTLTLLAITPSGGAKPQNLAISPDGRWLYCANMPGNSVVTFRIEAETGALTAVGEPLELAMPSCILILP